MTLTAKFSHHENSEKWPLQFPIAQVDVFKLLILSDQQSKPKGNQIIIIKNKENQKTLEKLEPENFDHIA